MFAGGLLSEGLLAVAGLTSDPRNGAAPKENSPPSEATVQ